MAAATKVKHVLNLVLSRDSFSSNVCLIGGDEELSGVLGFPSCVTTNGFDVGIVAQELLRLCQTLWPQLAQTIKIDSNDLVFLGKRSTPDFGPLTTRYVIWYYYLSGEIASRVGELTPAADVKWASPASIIDEFASKGLLLTPFTLELLRALAATNSNLHELQKTYATEAESTLASLFRAVEYAPGFEFIPIPSRTLPPFQSTNLVVVQSENECLIVDPGASPEGEATFVEVLKRLPSAPKVFLTHHHHDHVEGLPLVEKLHPSATVWDLLSTLSTSLQKVPLSNASNPIAVGKLTLEAIHSPGHTSSHMILFHAPTRTLLAGDHVVGAGSAVLDAETGDMRQYFATTRLMIGLDPLVTLPAHGPPCYQSIKLLQTYIAHRQAREDAILASVRAGKTTPEEIFAEVYAGTPAHLFPIAKSNIDLHLRKLREEAKL